MWEGGGGGGVGKTGAYIYIYINLKKKKKKNLRDPRLSRVASGDQASKHQRYLVCRLRSDLFENISMMENHFFQYLSFDQYSF